MTERNLLTDPCWSAKDLGEPLPSRPHAVSVALPRWADVIAYEEKNIFRTFSQMTKVTVRDIPKNDILYYIDNYYTLDKAGSYGIQDWFSIWIKKIDGCYYNVMGLRLSKFYKNYLLVKNN